mgnify:CR=1 FL=1
MRKRYNSNAVTSTKKDNFESAKSILLRAFKKYGLEDNIAKYKFVSHWPEIMGRAIAERSRPEYIRKNTLYISVNDSSWLQELSFQKSVILKRLQRFIAQDTEIKDIRFFVS